MPTFEQCSYKIYTLHGTPPGIFGETHVVTVGIHVQGLFFKGEYHILTERPQPRLDSYLWNVTKTGLHDEFFRISIAWALEESLNMARSRLAQRLGERADEVQNSSWLCASVDLREDAANPLPSCHLRGLYRPEMEELGRRTECHRLMQYLTVLRDLQGVQGAHL